MFNDFVEQLLSGDILAILAIIWICLRLVLGIFEFISSKNTTSLKKTIKGVEEAMKFKYRTESYQSENDYDKSAEKQHFNQYTDEYIFNEDSEELTATGGKIDNQAIIDSYIETCFEKVLDKFLPDGFGSTVQVPTKAVYGDFSETKKDLADYASMLEVAEDYRDRYGLSDDLNALQVFEAVKAMSEKQTAYVNGKTEQKAQDLKVTQDFVEQLKKSFKEEIKNETSQVE